MYTLFLADDEKNVLSGLQKSVRWEALGIKIVGTASNGTVACESIERLKPDFALVDVRMPGMTGLELIERLQGQLETLFLVFSGYDEFDYVKKAMDLDVVIYILKPSAIKEIEHAFIKAIERKNNLRLLDRYYNDSSHEDFCGSWESLLNSQQLFPALEHYQAYMSVRIGFGRPNLFSNYVELLNMFGTMRSPQYSVFPSQITGGIVLIVAFSRISGLNDARKAAEKEIMDVIHETSGQICYGIGNIVFSIADLDASLSRANIIYDYCRFAGMEQSDISTAPLPPNSSVMDLTSVFVERMVNGNIELSITDEVDGFLSRLMDGNLSVNQIKWICADMIYNIHYKILSEKNIQTNSIIMQDNISKSLLNVSRMEDLRRAVSELLESVREYIGIYHDKAKSSVIGKIELYIRDNLSSQFTLDELSEKFYLNPAYISYVFKKETGVNLFTYINDLRMSEAARLLKNTAMKINDIARCVGYNDNRYFCQVFKRKFGVTASEYRGEGS